MNNQNQPLYVLVLNDNGLIQNLTMGMEIAGLADITSRTIREYLEEHGTQNPWDKAPRNESGYANIYHGVPGESNAKVVWTYRFDGEESFEQMDTDLNEVVWAECRRLVEKFLLRNQGRIIKPVDYDCRNGYENELVRSIWDDFENPLLPIALCCKAHHVYTLIDDNGYALVPDLQAINRVGYILLDQACDIGAGFRLEPIQKSVLVG